MNTTDKLWPVCLRVLVWPVTFTFAVVDSDMLLTQDFVVLGLLAGISYWSGTVRNQWLALTVTLVLCVITVLSLSTMGMIARSVAQAPSEPAASFNQGVYSMFDAVRSIRPYIATAVFGILAASSRRIAAHHSNSICGPGGGE
jgi:hypothetical protein